METFIAYMPRIHGTLIKEEIFFKKPREKKEDVKKRGSRFIKVEVKILVNGKTISKKSDFCTCKGKQSMKTGLCLKCKKLGAIRVR